LTKTSKRTTTNTYVNSAGWREILYVTPVLAARTRTVMSDDDDVVDAVVVVVDGVNVDIMVVYI
jgi:hypothetical protein